MDNILLIHPDLEEREKLTAKLGQAGFETLTSSNSNQGIANIQQYHPKLVVIAEILPQVDGNQHCFRIRQITSAPIIVLGNQMEESAGIEMLESGADVYMPSPLNFREFVVRVRSLLRHNNLFDFRPTTEDDQHYGNHPNKQDNDLYKFTNTEHCLLNKLIHILAVFFNFLKTKMMIVNYFSYCDLILKKQGHPSYIRNRSPYLRVVS
ncbi:MAG: response regulator [Dehalococcoidales bacterium]|nr:response regulator [Dehalococcoidales bacterium]